MTQVQSAAKVYYIEEQVTVLLEIIQKAEPILNELSSIVHEFSRLQKLAPGWLERDRALYKRYGR